MIELIKNEFRQYKPMVFALALILPSSYSVYVFFDEEAINAIGDEDGFFEDMTAIFFLVASIFFSLAYFRSRKVFLLIFSIIFFVGFGEEISWGQRIIGFSSPEYFKKHNVQGETTLHNMLILNSSDYTGHKEGWGKVFTVKFFYKLSCVSFGVLLPIFVFYLNPIKKLVTKIGLPVPPIVLGGFFAINWLIFRLMMNYYLPAGRPLQYYDSINEISECMSSVVFLSISLAIYKLERKNLKRQMR